VWLEKFFTPHLFPAKLLVRSTEARGTATNEAMTTNPRVTSCHNDENTARMDARVTLPHGCDHLQAKRAVWASGARRRCERGERTTRWGWLRTRI